MRGVYRVAALVVGAYCAGSLSLASAVDDNEGVCKADGTGCQPPEATPTHFAEDGIAADIHKVCPLSRSFVRDYFQGAVTWFSSRIGFHKLVGLWPKDLVPDAWSDDYTTTNYVLVTQLMLGFYKTRSAKNVLVPTAMASSSVDDVIRVENIHAPRWDVDGTPNFFCWLERFLPGFVLGTLYVPSLTCFYSTLRRLSTDTNELNGTFSDDLDKPEFNTWEAAMKGTPFKRKVDWVNAFYEKSNTLDGQPLWPRKMTNFQAYFKNDMWDDALENAFAFHLIGSHRLESGSWTFTDLPGVETLTLPFRLPLNIFSAFAVREHFGKFGADMYFNADGMPVLIETPTGERIMRGDKQWQYWKFVWRSTLITGITLVDHLHITHFRTANLISRVTRETLEPDFPLRRVSSIFTFGSIFVNLQAMHTLIGPNHMLHRATPFKDFTDLSNVVPAKDSQIVADIPDIPAIKQLTNETAWNALHPTIRETPFFADAKLVMGALRKLVRGILDASSDQAMCPGGKLSQSVQRMIYAMVMETKAAHYSISGTSLDYLRADEPCTHPGFRDSLELRLATYFFIVTGWHRHVGFVGDYYLDPELATMSWKDGEAYGRPRQHLIMTVINVFTSTHQPLLKDDYTHLFQGMQPDLGNEFTALWREFQKDLQNIAGIIDERNKKRKVFNINLHPDILESAVSK